MVVITSLELVGLDGTAFSPDDLDLGTKHPGETIAVAVDFTQAIAATDTLITAAVAVLPAMPGGANASPTSISGSVVSFFASGGISGVSYNVIVTVGSLAGETLQPTLTMEVT